MERRVRLGISVACGAAAFALCLWYVGQVRGEADKARADLLRRYGSDVVTVPVATRMIEAGEVVDASDVQTSDWLVSLLPEGAASSVDEVVGREVSVPVAANAPFSELNFRDLQQMAEVPAGHVALWIPLTDKLGAGAGLEAGTHMVAYRAETDSVRQVAKDVILLLAPSAASGIGRSTLAVAVRAGDVEEVLAACGMGDLRLVVPADDVRELPAAAAARRDVSPVGQSKAQDTADGSDDGENVGKETGV